MPGWVAAAAPWTALAAVLLSCGAYVIGVVSMFTLDIEETCRLQYGQAYEPTGDARRGGAWPAFPLTQPCNAEYDLVPAWVNPLIVLALTIFAVSVVLLAVNWPRSSAPGTSLTDPDRKAP